MLLNSVPEITGVVMMFGAFPTFRLNQIWQTEWIWSAFFYTYYFTHIGFMYSFPCFLSIDTKGINLHDLPDIR